ncbi:hypothetical protein [Streptomyces sp. NPDC006309]|uniref:hypothetical protein n=1 Tax=Streptomyces sp. NPDC006309 TaxID=3156749 RepID=UPI0033B2D033
MLVVTAAVAVVRHTSDPASAACGTPPPGRVTGDIGVHDPSMGERPDGGYLVASTGDNTAPKYSPDRTAFRNTGTAFPDGASWTYPYTGNGHTPWAPDLSSCPRSRTPPTGPASPDGPRRPVLTRQVRGAHENRTGGGDRNRSRA